MYGNNMLFIISALFVTLLCYPIGDSIPRQQIPVVSDTPYVQYQSTRDSFELNKKLLREEIEKVQEVNKVISNQQKQIVTQIEKSSSPQIIKHDTIYIFIKDSSINKKRNFFQRLFNGKHKRNNN